MKKTWILSLIVLMLGCTTVQGPLGEYKTAFWEAQSLKPHPVSHEIRETIGPLALVLTPALMWTVAGRWGDKAGHCFAGTGSSLAIGLLVKPEWGWAVSIGLGVAKEQYDSDTRGSWDNEDLAVTALCGAVPFLVMEHLEE